MEATPGGSGAARGDEADRPRCRGGCEWRAESSFQRRPVPKHLSLIHALWRPALGSGRRRVRRPSLRRCRDDDGDLRDHERRSGAESTFGYGEQWPSKRGSKAASSAGGPHTASSSATPVRIRTGARRRRAGACTAWMSTRSPAQLSSASSPTTRAGRPSMPSPRSSPPKASPRPVHTNRPATATGTIGRGARAL